MVLNPHRLRRFRRRTWMMIAACLAFRASASLAGLDTDHPAASNSACITLSEPLSC